MGATAKAGSVGASLVSRIQERAARYPPEKKTKRLVIANTATTIASTENTVQREDIQKPIVQVATPASVDEGMAKQDSSLLQVDVPVSESTDEKKRRARLFL